MSLVCRMVSLRLRGLAHKGSDNSGLATTPAAARTPFFRNCLLFNILIQDLSSLYLRIEGVARSRPYLHLTQDHIPHPHIRFHRAGKRNKEIHTVPAVGEIII